MNRRKDKLVMLRASFVQKPTAFGIDSIRVDTWNLARTELY